MSDGALPHILGLGAYAYQLQDGTSVLAKTASPQPLGFCAPPWAHRSFGGPVLVGKARRRPGFNFDGTPAEDMQFGDKPAKSAAIQSDEMFQHSDSTLGACLRQLMESLSIGSMETVALEMAERFLKAKGGVYHNDILATEMSNNPAFSLYHAKFAAQLRSALASCGHDPSLLSPLPMDLLDFSSFWDKATGLGITIHQVWSIRAKLLDFEADCITGYWRARLHYTLYDHYGLDWEDILKHGEDRIPQYHTGDFFKAWYILQHYRGARPFIVKARIERPIRGRL